MPPDISSHVSFRQLPAGTAVLQANPPAVSRQCGLSEVSGEVVQ